MLLVWATTCLWFRAVFPTSGPGLGRRFLGMLRGREAYVGQTCISLSLIKGANTVFARSANRARAATGSVECLYMYIVVPFVFSPIAQPKFGNFSIP